MSKYIFIASDFEIPEVDLTNEQIITPIEAKLKGIKPPCFCSWDELDPNSEILYFESEDDIPEEVYDALNSTFPFECMMALYSIED